MKTVVVELPIIRDKYCKKCGALLPKYEKRSWTGRLFLTSERWTHCVYCNPYNPIKQKQKYEQRARDMVNQNPDSVKVLYECPCETEKKVRHHFDYAKAYEVLLFCYKCHGLEHRRLNILKKMQRLGVTQ